MKPTVHLFKSIALFVFTLVMSTFVTVAANAGNAGVQFSGVVGGQDSKGAVATFPKMLVSFGDEVALPIGGIDLSTTTAIVIDDTGMPVASNGIVSTANGGRKGVAMLVPLTDAAHQTFTVCEQGSGRCIQYQVQRY